MPKQEPIHDAKKILVTGAAGFIGFHLCRRLLATNAKVIGVDNLNDYYDVGLKKARISILRSFENFCFWEKDICDDDGLNQIFGEYSPDIVVNLAAQAGVRYSIDHPRPYIDSNIVGFFNVLEACRHHEVVHLVFASSSSVYGNQKKVPFAVSDAVNRPISLYAATKAANELMAYTYSHLYKIPTTGLRFFTVYGPFGRPDMAYFKFMDSIVQGRPIKIYNNGDMLRDFTYIDDIVTGIERLLFNPPASDKEDAPYRLYNIGGSRPEKLMTFIETLEKFSGKTAKKEFLPMQPGDVYQTYADASDLERDFGFRPTTGIEVGLKKFVEWYQDYYGIG